MTGLPPITIAEPRPDAPTTDAIIWRDTVQASRAAPAADDWISTALGIECHLVYLHDTASRPVNPRYALPGDTVAFADGYPVLLTSLDSLTDLNARLAAPIGISRFRGNIVISGAAPWAEDGWRRIRIGGAIFRVAKPCDRCIVTTIDPQTGERPDKSEPLRTLGTFRRDARGVMFGQNLVPQTLGRITVGDPVEVLEAGPPNVSLTPVPAV
jgi:hypothetical protein